jgi:DNA uptake protein ComE-like DNA-binding protein
MRVLYFLSALGFGLFAFGHYSARSMRPQPRRRQRTARTASALYIGEVIDLNKASKDDINALGLAEFYDRIIDERPFHSKFDLLERMIVPDALYREIKDRITVRHAA